MAPCKRTHSIPKLDACHCDDCLADSTYINWDTHEEKNGTLWTHPKLLIHNRYLKAKQLLQENQDRDQHRPNAMPNQPAQSSHIEDPQINQHEPPSAPSLQNGDLEKFIEMSSNPSSNKDQ